MGGEKGGPGGGGFEGEACRGRSVGFWRRRSGGERPEMGFLGDVWVNMGTSICKRLHVFVCLSVTP